ncbi:MULTISPECIES: FecCD family ABC transporter permease [unclassified Streptomyces]|uniref:FecCD family ABC transporter permease n=1 Tax=unclassified Streptomyces TaxID=2593676 RepID=UPI002DD888C6|nr:MULTISPECIES: iron chelate uptake ABC transporter family permease subunit [unclassified Streptomyces]WSC42113.1 iron chelate uptake ABC transporter family permease subunit [Streptomyces sp. NBC_01763]WSC59036.1 iron chelate uptake ABC transporter family permease subunit [Streptomyces sp. NBC_01761]WSF90160.1 iron chelate uptake ABC transporter family permease subunit [Streptomyces sp. NBC_01744]WSJ56366.1 iron chelate uptake ABC transporter family permease subunit [Streptomyces sp. NBC_01318
MKTRTKDGTGAVRSVRAVRTGGGLSFRVDIRALVVIVVLAAVAAGAAIVLIGSGDYAMTPGEVVSTLFGHGTFQQEFVVTDLRLPRVLVGLLVGAALGVGGAVFQTVSRNPLGSPDVLGFGQGATVGALMVIVLSQGGAAAVAGGAVVGGLVTGVVVYLLAWKRGMHGYRLVLVGIGSAAMLTAAAQYLITKANLVDATRAVVWMTGSLDGRDWAQVWPLLVVCGLLIPLVLGHGRALRMMEMGDDAAYALGVRVERTRLVLMGCAVLLVAVATAAAGPITFVSLSAPQLARRLTRSPGPNLASSAFMGAALLLVADWIAMDAFGDRQLPVGVVTGVLGGCYLLWLLVSERRAGRI